MRAENCFRLRASTGSDATAAARRSAVEIFSLVGFEFAAFTHRPETHARPALRGFGPPPKDLDSAWVEGLRSLVGDQGTTQRACGFGAVWRHWPAQSTMVRLLIVVTAEGTSALFTPAKVGPLTLSHRVVMAPMTRQRADQPSGVPGDLPLEYYTQRVSEGGLIISEAIAVSRVGHGGYGSPGLWNDDQVAGWRRITDAVHDGGGFIVAQLWHTGRRSHVTTSFQTPVSPSLDPSFWANPANTVSTEHGYAPVSPHRALNIDEIPSVVEEFAVAARNAAAAGFDGVELHAAYGFLLDQFLQDGSNQRTDHYGGSLDNRIRLL